MWLPFAVTIIVSPKIFFSLIIVSSLKNFLSNVKQFAARVKVFC